MGGTHDMNNQTTNRQQPAPKQTGEPLATFPRRGPQGVQQELRIALDEFEGHAYICASRVGSRFPGALDADADRMLDPPR